MRLKPGVFGGPAVILALGLYSQQAAGALPAESPAWARGEPEGRGAATSRAPAPTWPAAQDRAQSPDSAAAGQAEVLADPAAARLDSLKIGLRVVPLPFPIDLASELPEPARQRPELRPRGRGWEAIWAEELRARLDGWERTLWLSSRPVAQPPELEPTGAEVPAEPVVAALPDSAATLGVPDVESPAAPPPGRVEPEPGEPQLLPEVFDQYADLGVAIQGRVELGGGWNRFRPCSAAFQLNCDPGIIPTLRPDIQFGARLGGTISERIHVNVDYDNRREFDAANNINVYYQGLEDEILQRVEVGDVSFPLPQSRYLTQGIPAGNFGFRTTGQMGPIDFQAVWAQQKGDLGTRELQVGGGGQGFEQRATTILDDADYERGRFFFLFNPGRFVAYPHIDIQRLIASDVPPDVRPGSVIKVYRYEVLGVGAGARVPEGFITAVAVAVDTITTELGADTVVTDTLSGLFRPLIEGEDYALHQSGLWLQLRNTLPDREGLAVTYIAADGSEIGTFNAEAVSDAHNADPENVAPPTLELIKGVNHRPGTASWRREMHHVYRVSASPGVVASSIELIVSQGDPEVGNTFRAAPDGTQLEFLKIFGLDDDPTDNRLDASQIYEAEGEAIEGVTGPTGTYIVPPTLEPFRTPPPLRDVPGFSDEPFPLEAGDRNPVIYDETNDQIRRGANLYLLTVAYRQRFAGFLSSISLGAGGVREASERVVIDGVDLVRGEDYTIDYDIGQIELREPERWFTGSPDARVRVSFEQKPLFQLAPTTVFGFQARYGLGEFGEFNLIGLSQTEKTLQTRPELGLEPAAVRLGGFSGRLNFRPAWLTDFANALPGVESEAPSSINLDGEVALSMPTTNTQGVTYVEDFEGGSGFGLSLLARAWRLGSAPSTSVGAEPVAPLAFDEPSAAELVWQDQYILQTTEGQQVVGGLFPDQIDGELLIQGQTRPEPVLTLVARRPENRQIAPNPNAAAGPAWASITSVLSSNGQDFTTIEFLEFYVAVADDLADSTNLIIDLGTVSEDAFAVDSLGQPAGSGELDREVDPPQVWSNADDLGLWDTGCQAEPGQIAYPLGDVSANCTRNNGLEDSEDLNQNSVLDTEERFFRYTIRIGDPASPYFVRDANRLGTARFRLFRIPLRRPDHRERVTDAEFQNIRHLRLTLTTNSNNTLILARARFLGSRWLKRGQAGVVAGRADTVSAILPGALVEVGPISTLDARYVPPPGITDQLANQTDQFAAGGQAFNEQSLSVKFSELGPDERAEVYLQYVQTPRDFLAYRSMRVWALGIEGPWGVDDQPLRFLVKLGEDVRNFYLFQAKLPEVPPGTGGEALRGAWLPELEIEFDRFIALRTAAEEALLLGGGLPPDSVLQLWDVDVFPDGDSSYAVVISQRSRAPNLAAIRQLSLGVYNGGLEPVLGGELWVDDMRLGSAVDNTGVVGQFNLDISASDVLGINASYSSENPYFRQLAQDPSFRSSKQYQIGGRLRMGRLLPESWGVNMPISVSYTSAEAKPLLLPRTDVRVEQLAGLRTPDVRNLRTEVNLSRRRRVRSAPLVGWFLDNSSVRISYNRGNLRNSRSETESEALSVGYSYRSKVLDLSLPLLVKSAWRLRLTPVSLQLNASYVDSESKTRRFQEIIQLPADAGAVPIRRLDEQLFGNVTLNFEPLNALTGRVNFSHSRELVPTASLVQGRAARRLIDVRRSRLAGVDLGWETGRTLNINWIYRPGIASWLTPQASLDTRFRFKQDASYIAAQEADTVLTRDFSGSRALRLSTGFNAPALLRSLFKGERTGALRLLLGLMDRLDVVNASWSGSLSSAFLRQMRRPGLGYQFGFGGFEAFRVQSGESASRVLDNEVVTLSSGVRLPLGAGLTVNYSQNDAFFWAPITQTRARSTAWPSVNFNWNRIPLPPFLSRWASNLSVRTGYTRRRRRNETLGADQTREFVTKTIPLSVSLSLAADWQIGYTLNLSDEQRRDPTGVTLGDRTGHTVLVTGRVRPVTSTGTLRNPVRISFRFSQDDQGQCRQLGAAFSELPLSEIERAVLPSCEPFTDRRIRNIDLTIGTDVSPFTLGLQGSWRDTQSELGQRPGSTQLEISLFGQFLLESGEVR